MARFARGNKKLKVDSTGELGIYYGDRLRATECAGLQDLEGLAGSPIPDHTKDMEDGALPCTGAGRSKAAIYFGLKSKYAQLS